MNHAILVVPENSALAHILHVLVLGFGWNLTVLHILVFILDGCYEID